MLSFNLTLAVELALFLVFYAVSRRFFFVPLHRLIRERRAKIRRDEEKARSDEEEVQRVKKLHEERLAEAQQEAGRRLRETRFNAYTRNRVEIEKNRQQAEAEVAAFRAQVNAQIENERREYAGMLPPLVEAMNRQINVEGSLF